MLFLHRGPLFEQAGESSTGTGTGAPNNNGSTGTGTADSDLERRLAEARREEKAKLYPEIERLKAERDKQARDLADAKAALDAAREGSRQAQTLEQQVHSLESKLAGMTDTLSKSIDDALENQRKTYEEQNRRDRLAAKKDALLTTTTELIPELVTGETPEEIQANFEKSKAKYKAIQEKAAKDAEERVRKELGAPLREALPQPVVPGSQTTSAADTAGGLDSWRHMSPEEWNSKKNDIKRKVFQDAGLPMKQR